MIQQTKKELHKYINTTPNNIDEFIRCDINEYFCSASVFIYLF